MDSSEEDESHDYVTALSERARSVLTAFANAQDQRDPSRDPLFLMLVEEEGPVPWDDTVRFLAVIALCARRSVAALLPEPEASDFTLDYFRRLTLNQVDPGTDHLVLSKSFDLIAEVIPPISHEGRVMGLQRALVEAHGVRGVAAMCFIICRAAIAAEQADPSKTFQEWIAEWALAEQRDLMRGGH